MRKIALRGGELIAVLFVVFDVEVIFLFPWAVVLERLGAAELIFSARMVSAEESSRRP